MHTDSSAMATCLRLRSTVECTATVRMPSAWHARRMRSAISPRLAITTLSSMGGSHEFWSSFRPVGLQADRRSRARGWRRSKPRSPNDKEGLVEFDRLTALHQDLDHGAGDVGFDRVEHLHRFDDAQRLAGLDRLADGDE